MSVKFSYFSLGCLLFSVVACESTTPLDQAYWQNPKSVRSGLLDKKSEVPIPIEQTAPEVQVPTGPTEEVEDNQDHYSVAISSLSAINLGEIAGEVKIVINQTDVTSTIHLTEVPQNLMIGQRSITNMSCEELALLYPPPMMVSTMVEYKDVNEVDYSTVEALITDLNRVDFRNGDATDLSGKSYVVKAYVGKYNRPQPETAELIPIACGTIYAEN